MRGLVLVIAAAGCYGPTVPEGRPCSATRECPAPQVCDIDTCRLLPMPGDGAIDGPADAIVDGPPDAMIDAAGPPVCAQPIGLGAFLPRLVADPLAAAGLDGTPSVTSDLLEMYFKSSRANGIFVADIWRTSRASAASPWGAPTIVSELNSAVQDGSPDLSADRLTIYMSSNRAGGMGQHDIWRSTRATTTAPWSTPVVVTELSSNADEEGFTVGASGLVGYLQSNRGGNGGGYNLYRTTRTSQTSPWSTPVVMPEFGEGGDYENPAVTADDCALYFNSNRNGTQGAADLWVSTRTTPTGAWGAPVNLTVLNSNSFEGDPWISPDQRYIVFSAETSGGGSLEIHEARR